MRTKELSKANNEVELRGEILGNMEFVYERKGIRYYSFELRVERTSSNFDVIPVIAPEDIIATTRCAGDLVSIRGHYRSNNYYTETRRKLILTVYAQSIRFLQSLGELEERNKIRLIGYLCKPPVHRKTPLGKKITDLLVAVNKPYGEADYIPCICWGKNAVDAASFKVGDKCVIEGRIQSREYRKADVTHIAYEVSVSGIVKKSSRMYAKV